MKLLLLTLLFSLLSPCSFAQKIVPDQLAQWKNWVLKDDMNHLCPADINRSDLKECIWPKSLSLNISKNQGSFSGSWFVYTDSFITLPGALGSAWPIEVKDNGKAIPVINQDGLPVVFLKKGSHSLSGKLSWKKPPLRLALPKDIGLLSVVINNKKVDEPTLDASGDLWLARKRKGKERDFLQIKIYRKITDDIPATIETHLSLQVGGAERELTLPSLLLAGMTPMSSSSNLPIQWSPSGELKMRIKPGSWYATLKSRSYSPLKSLKAPQKKSPFPQEEFWVFVAKNNFRVADVEGVDQIDSQRLQLPGHFQGFPTYLVKEDVEVKIIEKSRGMRFVSSNKLNLFRTLWLDFDGDFFTVNDEIKGDINRDWRLEMNEPFFLGSVKMSNANQLITHDQSQDTRGVEVREGRINLRAESRLKKQGMNLPAIGWNQSFNNVRGRINIPPGWKTLALIGPDYSKGTWLSRWSLLSLFFVLVVGIGIFKLKGFFWSLVVLTGLILMIHEPGAPYWIWLHLLISLGLERSLKVKEKFVKFIKGYRWLSLLSLFVIAFPFVVTQIQVSIFPSLERSSRFNSFYSNINYSSSSSKRRAFKQELAQDDFADSAQEEMEALATPRANMAGGARVMKKAKIKRAEKGSWGKVGSVSQSQVSFLNQYDPNAQIQTGPGLPAWSWGNISFGWEGPVEKGQDFRLIALSPALNRLFTLVRIILLIMMAFCFIDYKKGDDDGLSTLKSLLKSPDLNTSVAIILFAVFNLLSPKVQADPYPSPEFLKELRDHIETPHQCYPKCGSVERMKVDYNQSSLTIRSRIHMIKEGFFTLPGSREQWLPEVIKVNGGNKFKLRGRNGRLLIGLPKGIHTVILSGKLPPRGQVQLSVDQKPALFESSGKGWVLEGLNKEGLISKALSLSRVSKASAEGKASEFKSNLLPQFLSLHRTFHFGVNWQVTTTITRMTPPTQALNFEIPKLAGETITSSNVVDTGDKGVVKVSLAKDQSQLSYQSILQIASPMSLTASEKSLWSETWQFVPGPIWRLKFENQGNLEKIRMKSMGNTFSPLYRPWPGEKLNLIISRPSAAKGETVTLSQASFFLTPGKRISDYELRLTFKTSIGLTHAINLPKASELQSVQINGANQSLSLEEGKLNLPLGVGKQVVSIKWKMPEGIGFMYKSPKIDLGIKGINLKTVVRVPRDRWILALGGPIMGPAVLFWGKLLALFILGFFLSKISWCPLNFPSWCILFIGLTQGEAFGIYWILMYLLYLSYRKQRHSRFSPAAYNITSIVAMFGAFISISAFVVVLKNGLLGGPLMNITGNDSSTSVLNWFVDRFDTMLPNVWIASLPTFIYQVLMLLWAICMTFTLIKWMPWMWEGFYGTGFFKPMPGLKTKKPKADSKTNKKDDHQ